MFSTSSLLFIDFRTCRAFFSAPDSTYSKVVKTMLNNEAKLLESALQRVNPQQQAYLIVYHDMATMLSHLEGLSVRKRQVISAAAILHAACGHSDMKMMEMLEENHYVPSYKRSVLNLVYALSEPDECKEAQILHDALLLTECILYPIQTKQLETMIISDHAKRILKKYELIS